MAYEEDIELVERVLAHEPGAWREMYALYANDVRWAVIRTVRRYTPADADTLNEDLTADIWMALAQSEFSRLRSYNQRSSLRQWLKAVTINRCIDYFRRRRPTTSLEIVPEHIWVDEDSPERIAIRRERRRALEEMVNGLCDDDRRFVDLYYNQAMSYDEVASALGTTLGAVYARRNRVRRKLTKMARERGLREVG